MIITKTEENSYYGAKLGHVAPRVSPDRRLSQNILWLLHLGCRKMSSNGTNCQQDLKI